MKAIILSAGRGTRMMPLTANTPKCLLDIGRGLTVLESQLDVLRICGFSEVDVVAGYLIEQVRQVVEAYDGDSMRVRVVHNPFYASTNNIVSLWLGLLPVKDVCVSINGDDIFKDSVMKSLLSSAGNIVMTINRKDSYDSDDMLVVTEGNFVRNVGKTLDRSVANGESVGIVLYRNDGLQAIKLMLDSMLRDEHAHQYYYLEALQRLMDDNYPILSCEVGKGDWAEIDFHPDVEDVRAKLNDFLKRME